MSSGEHSGGGGDLDSTATLHVEYHEQSESYRTEFDRRTRPVSEAVVTAVASAAGTGPLELPPLWSALDPDALDRFFASLCERAHAESAIIFEYAGHEVTVKSHGTVIVEPGMDAHS